MNKPINLVRNIKYIPIGLQQKTLAETPLLPLIGKSNAPTDHKDHNRWFSRDSDTTQHAGMDGMTVERVDFMGRGGVTSYKFNVCVAAEEGISVP
jgi:hypothetical protein